MNGWTLAWFFWIAMFFAIEIPAIVDKDPGDTLTEHTRRWFSTRTKSVQWRLRRLVLLFFLVWLVVHFFAGW